MIDASSEFRALVSSNHTLLVRARLRLADGTVEELSGSDLMGVSMEEATSSDGSFDIGAAVIGSATVTLQNFGAQWDACDFTGASIALWVGKELTDGTTEWLRRGTWWVDQPDSYGGTIGLSCLDALSRLEVPWGSAGLAFPATVGEVSEACCRAGGVALDSADFPGHDAAIPATATVPDGSTCLDALRWAAQAAGLFARATPEGRVAMGWYDLSALEGEDWLDGEGFDGGTPSYQSGDDADGGTLADYSMGDRADGGTFDSSRDRPHLYAFSQLTVGTDDVVITGVSVTAQDEATDGGTGSPGGTTLVGSEGYVLSVEGNPLVPYGHDAEVAKRLAARVVGMRFRPLSGTFPSDPTLQAGDAAVVTDRRQNSHMTLLTSVSLTVNGGVRVACSAKSASRNSAERAGAATSAYVAARKDTDRKLSSRDLAIRDLRQRLDDSGGLYHTEERLSDGSTVFFMHDKPTVAESRVIWKMTAEAVAVSTDGGKTYATGLSANGDAVLNRIYAIGINADHITTGTLDASAVSVRNLMRVGDDASNIGLGAGAITFNSSGVTDLSISTKPYTTHTYIKYADGPRPLMNSVTGEDDCGTAFSDVLQYDGTKFPYMDGGGYKAYLNVQLTYNRSNGITDASGSSTLSKEAVLDVDRNGSASVVMAPFKVTVGITNEHVLRIKVEFDTAAEFVAYYKLWGIKVRYSNAARVTDIRTSSGDRVVSSENFSEVLDGKAKTCLLSMPYQHGNQMVNVRMTFSGGILTGLESVTPTDDSFSAYAFYREF